MTKQERKERAEWLRRERELWVMNNKQLFNNFKRSGLELRAYVNQHTALIDRKIISEGGEI